MAMTGAEVNELIDKLNKKKNTCETDIAVLKSDLSKQEEKLEETLPKVEKIVGSTDAESVKEFLQNLDNEIKLDIAKLNEMGE
jgi:flagellar biosynthesis chaperone FliJ